MSPKQKKLAGKAPPPNKIDEKDFAVLRQEKAKGRGMGLQDEKLKEGKTVKASLGLLAMKKAKDKEMSSVIHCCWKCTAKYQIKSCKL